jgi:[CysO sulfur-carrier protein]-S-L-cysteine hydrolase
MKLLLPDTVENQMKRELRVAGRREIGGVLLGELVGPRLFRVAEITVQRTSGTSSTFVRIPRLHIEAIQAFFERTGHNTNGSIIWASGTPIRRTRRSPAEATFGPWTRRR